MDGAAQTLARTEQDLKIPTGLRVLFATAVVLLMGAALLLGLLPANVDGGAFAATVAYWSAAVFAVSAFVYAVFVSRGAERVFWGLLGGGFVLRVLARTLQGAFSGLDLHHVLSLSDPVYVLSRVLLLSALLWMAAHTVRNVTPLATLNTLSLVISSGLLIWYFMLGSVAAEQEMGRPLVALVVLFGPVCDIGLLYLALTILSTGRRPPFTGFLLSAISVFVILDALRLRVQPFEKLPFGVSEFGDWPKLLWAFGIILLGLTAAKGASESFVQQLEIGPRGVYAFWLGPLSPPIHYSLLLVWGAFNPPLPRYVLLGGAALMLCLALRLSVSSGYSRKLRLEVERLVKRRERRTVSEELHDTLKQSVYSTALLLATYRKAREKKSPAAAEEILDRAVHASREANHRISRPIEEMRVLSSEPESDIVALLRRLGDEVHRYFGVKVHEDLRADLDVLDAEERATAYRIAGEALWNAAKHSGARNVWIESGEEGSTFSVGVRDDGSGLDADGPAEGIGFSLMRSRARETGAILEVGSQPGKGTLVRVSFEKG